jgi:hypothetical protein
MNQQRTSRRQRVLKRATIAFDGAAIDCLVRNISATGAAFDVESQIGIAPQPKPVIQVGHFDEICRVLAQGQSHRRVFQPQVSADGTPPATKQSRPCPIPRPIYHQSTCPSLGPAVTGVYQGHR